MAARLCALRAHITAPPPRLPTTRTRQTSHETPTLQLPPNYETPDHTNKSRTSADWRLAQPDAGFDDQLSAPHVCDQCGRMKARTGAADRSRRCRPQASDLRRSFQVKRRPRYGAWRIRPARILPTGRADRTGGGTGRMPRHAKSPPQRKRSSVP